MTLHKEGTELIICLLVVLTAILSTIYLFLGAGVVFWIMLVAMSILALLVINFFRYQPRFHIMADQPDVVVAPADGTVVVVEPTCERRMLNGEECLQVSIFMSVFNIHVNWIPVNGVAEKVEHTKGRFRAAYLPKSSEDNESASVLIRTEQGFKVLVRQIAGAVAQRIVTYPKIGEHVHIDSNLGFIKFGSRVDLFLPLDSEVLVEPRQKVQGNITVIARLPKAGASTNSR